MGCGLMNHSYAPLLNFNTRRKDDLSMKSKIMSVISYTLLSGLICTMSSPTLAKEWHRETQEEHMLFERYGEETYNEQLDLVLAQGAENGLVGYVLQSDLDKPIPHGQARLAIPLYNLELEQIDVFYLTNGLFDVDTSGMTLEEVTELAGADTEDEIVENVTPTASKVYIDEKNTSFDAYTINENNYFKLRDIASVISGTDKQFDVSWDETKNAINLLSDSAYTVTGGEMKPSDGVSKTAILSTSIIYVDGQEVSLTAYTIDDSNYFMLRDLCEIFDIEVTWDNATNTISITA